MIYFVRSGIVHSVSSHTASSIRFFNCKLDFSIGFSNCFMSKDLTFFDSYNLSMVAFK